jgi:hypothetical protein
MGTGKGTFFRRNSDKRCSAYLVARTGPLLAMLGAALPAAADSAPPARAHLTLHAPADCASEDAIAARVRARSARIAFVTSAEDVPDLQVELRAEPTSELSAALTVSWPDGRRSERQVAAKGCADAVEAIAFLIVLTLDPRSQPGSDPPAARNTATAAHDPNAAPAEPQVALHFDRVELGLIAQMALGIAPGAMYGFGVRALAALRGPSVWAPALQLRASRLELTGWAASGGIADFRLYSVQLDACPLGLFAGPLTARACLAAALGDLTASGRDTFAAEQRARLWLTWGATLALQLDLGAVAQVGVNAGLLAPFRRDRYAFRPAVFHEVGQLGFVGDLSVGVRFP